MLFWKNSRTNRGKKGRRITAEFSRHDYYYYYFMHEDGDIQEANAAIYTQDMLVASRGLAINSRKPSTRMA